MDDVGRQLDSLKEIWRQADTVSEETKKFLLGRERPENENYTAYERELHNIRNKVNALNRDFVKLKKSFQGTKNQEYLDLIKKIAGKIESIRKKLKKRKAKEKTRLGLGSHVYNLISKEQKAIYKNTKKVVDMTSHEDVDILLEDAYNEKELIAQWNRKIWTNPAWMDDEKQFHKQRFYLIKEVKTELSKIEYEYRMQTANLYLSACKSLKVAVLEKKIAYKKVKKAIKDLEDEASECFDLLEEEIKPLHKEECRLINGYHNICCQIRKEVKKIEPIIPFEETKKRLLHNIHMELCMKIKKIEPIADRKENHINNILENSMLIEHIKGKNILEHITCSIDDVNIDFNNQDTEQEIFKEKKRKKKKKRKKYKRYNWKKFFLKFYFLNKDGKKGKIDRELIISRRNSLKDRFHLFEFSPYHVDSFEINILTTSRDGYNEYRINSENLFGVLIYCNLYTEFNFSVSSIV